MVALPHVESRRAAHIDGVTSPIWRAGLDLICKRRWRQFNKIVGSEASLKKEGCAPYRIEVRCEGKMGRTHKTQAARPNMRFIYPHFTRKFAGCDHGG